jgi:hypothetical protein
MMARIRFALLALCLAASTVCAQTPEQLFQQGNSLYQQGNFAGAIERYEGIVKTGAVNGELLFNLGNAYYKQGNMGKAILCYERALRLLPGDDDLRHNLQMANLQLVDRIDPAPRLFVWDWWDGMKAWFSLEGITWFSYLFVVLTAAAVIVIILARRYSIRRVGVISLLVVGCALLCTVTILLDKAADAGRSDEAVVTATITTVKNSPDSKSSDAFVLHAGVKIRLTDSVSEWVKIRLADGKVGWMERTAAEVI